MSREQVVEAYFLEHRAKLIDIAAFLDRVDRAGGVGDDFRLAAFRKALAVCLEGKPERARRVLEVFSDPTEDLLASAQGMKGACGAYPGAREEA